MLTHAGEPFIHNVNFPRPKPQEETVLSIARVKRSLWDLVEPDGIEPTTSCLQSTRSTN